MWLALLGWVGCFLFSAAIIAAFVYYEALTGKGATYLEVAGIWLAIAVVTGPLGAILFGIMGLAGVITLTKPFKRAKDIYNRIDLMQRIHDAGSAKHRKKTRG